MRFNEERRDNGKDGIPLLVVPYMGETGRRLCEEHEIAWLDLSGNARIKAPGLLINVEGKPNRFKSAGRPPNLFAPKSSRMVHQFLIQPDRALNQRELSQAADLDEGYTSRIVGRFEESEHLAGPALRRRGISQLGGQGRDSLCPPPAGLPGSQTSS